ncbi:MAG TPA: VOC family protein [Polyangiales bacterium]|nr:VOC family protein [Polyangiales bacterium]
MAVSLITCMLGAACSDGGAANVGAQTAAGASAAAAGAQAASPALAGAWLAGAGIGVTDLDKSQEFYVTVLGMALRYELPVPGYVNERILYYQDSQGSDVVLMNFIDGQQHNYLNNPAKLVFYVPSAKAVIEAIRARGLPIVSEPTPQAAFNNTVIGFARDPDGYILEIIEQPTLTEPYLGAIGLGVADLDKAKDFYTRVLGMQPYGELLVVPNVWDEWILRHPSGKGSSLVIMHFTDGMPHNYLNNPLKTAHFLADAAALSANVAKEGLPILSPPMVFDVLGTKALISLARDPDGYTLEMVTTPAP